MKTKATYYHAGCPVCLEAEGKIVGNLDRSKIELEIVHLGQAKERVAEAESVGVRSVPALVVGGGVLHINHGADLAALR